MEGSERYCEDTNSKYDNDGKPRSLNEATVNFQVDIYFISSYEFSESESLQKAIYFAPVFDAALPIIRALAESCDVLRRPLVSCKNVIKRRRPSEMAVKVAVSY